MRGCGIPINEVEDSDEIVDVEEGEVCANQVRFDSLLNILELYTVTIVLERCIL